MPPSSCGVHFGSPLCMDEAYWKTAHVSGRFGATRMIATKGGPRRTERGREETEGVRTDRSAICKAGLGCMRDRSRATPFCREKKEGKGTPLLPVLYVVRCIVGNKKTKMVVVALVKHS